MEHETFERALHMWPDWHESIRSSRLELGYDPKWPVAQAARWINENYSGRVRPNAESELERLGLPPNLREYWEDCFYCDYHRLDGSSDFNRIRRATAYEEVDKQGEKTGRWVPGNRSLPKLPYEIELVHYPDDDIHSEWLRFELMIHTSFAGRDMLDEATGRALWLLRHLHSMGHPMAGRHPVAALISRAKANLSQRKRNAVRRYLANEIDFEGLLEEEWIRADTQVDVRQNIRVCPRNWSGEKALKYEQDRIYNRVRRWFPDPKPKVAQKGTWRHRLPMPSDNNDT